MDPTVLGSLIGVVGSLIIGGISWLGKTNKESMTKITASVANIESQVTAIRIDLPTKYVGKEEMLRHIQSEENWQHHINSQLREIREEISSVRDWTHRS
jgi:hypothetical protein